MKRLNLNSEIRFRIAESARDRVLKNTDFHISVDPEKDGWYSTPLWQFMNLFGPAMFMGNNPVVELDILIRDEDLKEVQE